jgi:hypothetical protein
MAAWNTTRFVRDPATLVAVALTVAAAGCKTPEPYVYEGEAAGDCIDGEDNDADGATDCDDSDCEFHLDCNPNTSTWDQTTTVTDTEPTDTAVTDGYACTADDLTSVPSDGTLLIDKLDGGILPLCSGEFLASVDFAVQWMNLDLAELATWGNIDRLSRMRIDPAAGLMYAIQDGTGNLAVYNLEDGTYSTVASLPGPVVDVEVGADGTAWVTSELDTDQSYVGLIGGDPPQALFEFDLGYYGTRLSASPGTSSVFLGGGPDDSLTRAVYDAKAGTMAIADAAIGVCFGAAHEVDATDDGSRVTLVCGGGNDGGDEIIDFDGNDLGSDYGQFDVAAGPLAGAFSPDETRYATFDGTMLTVFDVTQHASTGTHAPNLKTCPGAAIQELAWSRGGSILFASFSCDADPDAALAWWVVD